ncbi:hypothetical protein Pyn_13649 [Prunus yedoensis var. nudiflora]|uniref:Uncharacterized protein n=1 Tax=Prunus yedoensis var. nudiflora TaxID=2094558 RepID=A0A314YX26_PRUYE|nr:hypothetical protein Pyn_13649 [Prunus yedoensis var. nudiflora]
MTSASPGTSSGSFCLWACPVTWDPPIARATEASWNSRLGLRPPLAHVVRTAGSALIHQKNLYEMEIAMFCHSRPITDCHVEKLSHVAYCDWPGIAK